MSRNYSRGLPVLVFILSTFSQTVLAQAANVSSQRLLSAESDPSQWMTYGRTYEEQRYSPLDQINTDNIKDLGLAWYSEDYDTNTMQAGTPLYIDGVVYVSTAWSKVYAFDAKTGEKLWFYNSRVPGEWAVKVCCGYVNRGIAAYNGKIYLGTLDARLVAIDARTGEEVWSTLTFDESNKDSAIHRYSITQAPRVANGMVFIGNSGSEFGVRGYVSAYDAEIGQLKWRFYTVPGNPEEGFENEQMEMAAKTWGGDWWKLGGGGTVWDGMIYDEVNNLLVFGTGNGTPWNQKFRDPTGGDNLFLASIIAVNADTGEYVWHYQVTPAETWDYDATSPLMIAEMEVDGDQRRVVMQPSKSGMFYMLDAKSGELLRAAPFTEVNWNTGVDMETGRPKVVPEARYEEKPFNLLPGVQGAHGWHANSFDPQSGLLYIPTQVAYYPMVEEENYQVSEVGFNLGINFGATFTYYRDNPGEPSGFTGHLKAYNPVTGEEVWRSEDNQGTTGGAVVTAGGLVFQGNGGGNEFRAFNVKTGEKLWSAQAQTAVLSGPITYELDGTQYVAVSVGGNAGFGADYYTPNHSRLLVFALGGDKTLPPVEPYTPRPLDPPPLTASAEQVEAGADHYGQFCAACHGEEGQTRGSAFPNLTRTPLLHAQPAFDTVVLQGTLEERGMVSFGDVLTEEDTAAIRAYLISRANYLKDNPPPAFGFGPPPEEEEVEQPHQE